MADTAWRRDTQVEQSDSRPYTDMTMAALTLSSVLYNALAFKDPDMPHRWKEFMLVFLALYNVTSPHILEKKYADRIAALETFFSRWRLYGTAVEEYTKSKDAEAIGEGTETTAARAAEATELMKEINPDSSIAMLKGYVNILVEKGIYTLPESGGYDEGPIED